MQARRDPNNRNAGLSGHSGAGVGKNDLPGRSDNHLLKPNSDADQVPLFTAAPCGVRWQVKVVAADGSVARLGRFDNRLTALGASVLLARR